MIGDSSYVQLQRKKVFLRFKKEILEIHWTMLPFK